jgi:hypothetical protein
LNGIDPKMKVGGEQALAGGGAPPAETPLDAEMSPFHSMMIYDAMTSEEDGVHTTQKKTGAA